MDFEPNRPYAAVFVDRLDRGSPAVPGGDSGPASMALFAEDREASEPDCEPVRVGDLSLHRPRQWGRAG